MKIRLHIVGLRYYGWRGRMAEIFASPATQADAWMGQELFLQRDHQCAQDAHAVMAWSVTEPVGHVCKADLPLIAGVLEQGKADMVMTRIVGLDTQRRSLVVESVDELPEVPYAAPQHPAWPWEGPMLKLPAVWAQTDHYGRMMTLMAKGGLAWNDEVARRYMQGTVTDLSGDAYAVRFQLSRLLLQSPDPRLRETGHRLLAVMDHMGSDEQMTDWYTRLMPALTGSPEAQSMASRYAEADAQQMLQALRSFPYEIGREWLSSGGIRFAARLYYAQLPRTLVLKLLSVIILYTSACRRMQPPAPQPSVGLSLNGPCQMDVAQLTNKGTLISFEQPVNLTNP